MTLVKMCGLHRLEDIAYVNEVGPDMAGMILVPGFRRSIGEELAASMLSELSESVLSVGVFMDQPIEEVIDEAGSLGLSAVQLHGSEDATYIIKLQETLKIPVIKSFGITANQLAEAESSPADMVLIDPGHGSGQSFNLSVLEGFERKIIIAGGLTPENVADTIRKTHPFGVDASSGIETNGSKDKEKMFRFISAVRAEDAQKEGKI
jgi:phosphoribosylanthranilate isomerase